MPAFISMLWGALALSIKSLVGRVLVALGISFITYQGIDLLIASIKSDALAMLSSVPPQLIGAVGMLRLGESLSVIASAVVAKYAIMGLQGGSITKMVTK
jgi:hypothetical protein